MKNNDRKSFNKMTVGTGIICAVLILYAISVIALLLWGVITSLKSNMDFMHMKNVIGLPNLEYSHDEVLKLGNYKLILDNFVFQQRTKFYSGATLVEKTATLTIPILILNTIAYAGGGCVILAFVPAITAYMCAKYKFKMSKVIYVVVILVMSIPIVGNQPAMLTLVRNLGIYDTFIGNYIQKFSFVGMYFLVFYAFFEDLPDSYAEAAEIDGASQFRVLTTIILPLAIKMLTTVMLIQFVTLWNDYETPLLYLPTHSTLAYGVYYMAFRNSSGKLSNVPARVSACMILAVPILIVFLFLKDKLMGNISLGGVKE
ncbi:MAG TPA: hypothetical protein DEV87_00940 [Clostridiales bacterium]|nr:hypothetical protein [Clostridiales bacterium]